MNPILVIIIFFCLQAFVLFCCLAISEDEYSKNISDQEQMEYLRLWMKQKKSK